MRPYVALRYIGLVLLILGAFMLLSAGVSLLYGDRDVLTLVYSALVAILFGAFPMVFVPAARSITPTEGLVIVVGGWLLSCLVGALPFILWGGEFSVTDAWFESVSGLTTTGASILNNVEAVPHGLLFWRASTHWIGGLGILMFVLSVLPAMGMAGMVLYRIEMSSLAHDNFRQSVRNTARILLAIYGGLTVAEIIALLAVGMDLFDAVTHSFATIATGGFSTRNAGVAAFDSWAVDGVIGLFMILSGVHFGLLFATIVERRNFFWNSTVFRYYLTAMVIGSALITVLIHGGQAASWPEAFRRATFQVISVGTSTGFANADSSVWPALAQVILMLFALQCACAGSTSGGIKADRFVLFGKGVMRQLRQSLHPRAITRVRLDGKTVEGEALGAAMLYIVLYLVIVLVGGMLLVAFGVDPVSAFSGTIAAAGNVGPGLGSVGSQENYSQIPALGKWVLTGVMLLGRLEIYGLIMLLMPGVWRRMAAPTRQLL